MPIQEDATELYRRLIDGWDAHDAAAVAAAIASDGLVM